MNSTELPKQVALMQEAAGLKEKGESDVVIASAI